jgi:hypothetical protein
MIQLCQVNNIDINKIRKVGEHNHFKINLKISSIFRYA